MATAYHLEALRKTRVLERAFEARKKLEAKQVKAEEHAPKLHHHHHHHNHCTKRSRPLSAQSNQSKKNKSVSDAVTGGNHHSGSKSVSPRCPDEGVYSRQEVLSAAPSHTPVSNRSHNNMSTSLHSTAPSRSHTPSVVGTSPPSRPDTGISLSGSQVTAASCSSSLRTCSCCPPSRCSECMRSAAERRASLVRSDLHKQEMVLRDSNLVMGPVSVEEEIRVRKIEAGARQLEHDE